MDIQDALSSVTEVAIFAWTLIELLFTRILPLIGFLTGYLLLSFASLLSSAVAPAASRRRKRGREYSWHRASQAEERFEEEDIVQVVEKGEYSWVALQAEELVEREDKAAQAVKKEEDDQQNVLEHLKGTHAEPEGISQRISREEASVLPRLEEEDGEAEAAATVADAALPKAAPLDQGLVTESHDPGNEKQARGNDQGHVAELSRHDLQAVNLPPSDTSDQEQADEAKKQNRFDVVGAEEGRVSSKAESGAGKMNSEPSDTQPIKEAATSLGNSGEIRKMSGDQQKGAEMRKSSSRSRGSSSILRVLPPSLSQVKRTLKQGSRRVTFSHTAEAQ